MNLFDKSNINYSILAIFFLFIILIMLFDQYNFLEYLFSEKKVVEDFYKIGIALGAKDEGSPGPRHGRDYYAYIRDPDGNKICVFKKI